MSRIDIIATMTHPRLLLVVLLGVVLVAALILAAAASIWFLLPVPFLSAGAYGVWAGLTPGQLAEALDDPTASRPFPF